MTDMDKMLRDVRRQLNDNFDHWDNIAKVAKVSKRTIYNVVDKKANPSTGTISQLQAAIEKLGLGRK